MALYFFAMYVLGASLGPLGTGLASDYFTFQAASAAGAVAAAARSSSLVLAELRSLIGEPKGFDAARARAVPSAGTAHGDVHRPDAGDDSGGRPVRGVAHGQA